MSWHSWAIISAVATGITAVFAKAGLEGVPSHLGNAVRTAIVLVIATGILFFTGEHQKTSSVAGKQWLFLALSGAATAVAWVAYFKALSVGAATPVTAIDKASLIVTMVFSILLLGEAFSWKTAVGSALIVAGAILAADTK